MVTLSTLLSFIRLRMATYIASRGLIGYLLFNGLDLGALAVFVSIFFSTAAIYSYNQLTDKEEDKLNRGEIKPLVENGRGLIGLFVLAGFGIAGMLGGMAPVFWLILLMTGVLYSVLKIKWIFPIKNLYIGLGGALTFLYGASPQMEFVPAMLIGAALMALIAFIVSYTADLRDIAGDKQVGIRTIPVVVGKAMGELIAYLAIAGLAIFTTAMNLVFFYPLAILAIPATYHLGKKAYVKSQTFVILSVILTPTVLIMLKIMGVS